MLLFVTKIGNKNRMIEAKVRNKIQPLFDCIGKIIGLFCTPNMITFFAFLAGLTCCLLICCHYFVFAICFLLLSGLFDILDGTVARLTNNNQKIGAYIDLISDRMVEALVVIGLAIAWPQYSFAYILFLIALLFHFSTFLAAGALFTNTGIKGIHFEYSFIERAEAFMVFCLLLLFPKCINYVLIPFSLLIVFDGLRRFARVIQSQTGDT